MRVLGAVVRVQVQRSRLKPGERGARVYDPSPLLEVEALEVGPRGVVGLVGGRRLVDVHHADHPDTRHVSPRNALSVLPRAHYDRLRAAFGPHLVDGVAGESLLLDGPALTLADLAGPLALESDDGTVPLGEAFVAAPCVEFTRFVLGRPLGDTGPEVVEGLAALDGGARGFYLQVLGEGVVRPGARLLQG